MLHMQGDQWLKTLPCCLVRSMMPLDHLHSVPARPEHHWSHRRSHHGLGCASVLAMPHHRGNADCLTWLMNTTNASFHPHCIINPKFLMLFHFVVLFFVCLFSEINSFGVHLFHPIKSSLKTLGRMDSFFPFLSTLLEDCLGLCLATSRHSACLLEMCQRS